MDWFIFKFLACPYCFSYSQAGRDSYFGATLLLILLPLILLTLIAWYAHHLLTKK